MPKDVRTPQTAETLVHVAERLETVAAQLRSVSDAIKAHSLTEIHATHNHSLSVGLVSLEGFANAAKAAFLEALEAKGHFWPVANNSGGEKRKPAKK